MAQSAVERFVRAAIKHGELESARSRNRAFDELVEAAFEIGEDEDKGRSTFAALLDHENHSVVHSAAWRLLWLDEPMARASLERVSRDGPPLVGFSAEMTLKEWDAGRLTPPKNWERYRSKWERT